METWTQIEPGFWTSNFGNYSHEPPPGWTPPAPVALGTLASAVPSNWWDNSERYQGDASGVGSNTSITNPNTGKAESLVSVNKAGPDGVYGQQKLVPYSEYQRLVASDPSWKMTTLKAPGQDMIDVGFGGQIMDAIEATAPMALSMAAPGLSQLVAGLTGLSAPIASALTGAGSSLLTGGNPLTGAATSLAGSFLGGLGDVASGAGTQLPGGQAGFDLLSGMDVGIPAQTLANAGSTLPPNFQEFAQMFGDVSSNTANAVTAGLGDAQQIAQAIPNAGTTTAAEAASNTGSIWDGLDDYGNAIGLDNTSATYIPPTVENVMNPPTVPDVPPTGGAGAAAGVGTGTLAAGGGLAALASGGSNGQGATVDDYGVPIGTNNTGSTYVPPITTGGVNVIPTIPGSGGVQGGGSNGQGTAVDDYGNPIGTNNTSGTYTGTTDGGTQIGPLSLQELLKNPTLENFSKLISGAGGGYQLPLAALLTGLMSSSNNADNLKLQQDAAAKAAAAADPFASQRPFYQQQLNSMFTDPNYFNNNALLKGANTNAINDTSRALAARGYNGSGNEGMDIAQRLQANNMNFGQNLMTTTAGLAGANVNPGTASGAILSGANNVTAANNQSNGQLGNIISNLFNGVSGVKSNSGGTPSTNQTLQQFLFG